MYTKCHNSLYLLLLILIGICSQNCLRGDRMKSLNDLIWKDETVENDDLGDPPMVELCMICFCGGAWTEIMCHMIPFSGFVC